MNGGGSGDAGTLFEKLWTIEQTAEVLNVSTSWLYKAARAAKLPSVRIGAAVRFEPQALREWLEQRRQQKPTFDNE
jgi:excisionase family DNA binding protein